MNSDPSKRVALVTGASAGLGLAVARRFAMAGFELAIVGRNSERLNAAAEELGNPNILRYTCDVTERDQVQKLFDNVKEDLGRLDVLINIVGMSDRGLVKSLTIEHLDTLFRANMHSALLCSQAALPMLESTGGQIINIGSLAAKAAPRYLGGYSAVKHALAAITQQMRLECKEMGVNVILVSPGPIRREDEGNRYRDKVTDEMPESANRPAGGTTVKGLQPQYVAQRIYRAYCKRSIDVILPGHLRPIIGIGHLIPSLGDRLLLWFTRNKK